MAFTAKDVQKLREMTGVGMMDCKKALTEADGNIDKAIEILREKGLAASAKKAGRIAAEGAAYAAVIDGIGVVVEVNAETDFVGKNEKFVDFVKGVAATVAKQAPADLDALMECKYDGTDLTVTLEVPIEMGNDYMNLMGEIPWTFMVEEVPPDTTPDTGDWFQASSWIALAAVLAALLICLILGKKFRRAEQ